MPVQSFWSNTIEVSLAVHARNKDKIKKWGDLAGKRVFTGPLPFDVRAHIERALNELGVKFIYHQVDLATVGSQLESGAIDAMLHLYRVRRARRRRGSRKPRSPPTGRR